MVHPTSVSRFRHRTSALRSARARVQRHRAHPGSESRRPDLALSVMLPGPTRRVCGRPADRRGVPPPTGVRCSFSSASGVWRTEATLGRFEAASQRLRDFGFVIDNEDRPLRSVASRLVRRRAPRKHAVRRPCCRYAHRRAGSGPAACSAYRLPVDTITPGNRTATLLDALPTGNTRMSS